MNTSTKSGWLKAGLIAGVVAAVLAIGGKIPCIGCLFCPINCIAWFALPLICGYLAGLWSHLSRDEYKEGAMNGALAGVVLGIIGGGISFILTVVFAAINIGGGTVANVFGNSQADSLDKYLTFLPVGIMGSIILGILMFFVGLVWDVLLSTVGGIINVALSKKS